MTSTADAMGDIKGGIQRSGGYLLVNEACDDLSAEGYAALGILVEMVWAVQTLGYKMARALDRIGARDTLVQRKKMAFNKAKEAVAALIRGLEVAFGETFDYAMCRVPGEEAVRTEALQTYADDLLRLFTVYYSRVDGWDDPDKRARVHKAVANFKQLPGFDVESLLNFLKIQ